MRKVQITFSRKLKPNVFDTRPKPDDFYYRLMSYTVQHVLVAHSRFTSLIHTLLHRVWSRRHPTIWREKKKEDTNHVTSHLNIHLRRSSSWSSPDDDSRQKRQCQSCGRAGCRGCWEEQKLPGNKRNSPVEFQSYTLIQHLEVKSVFVPQQLRTWLHSNMFCWD